MYLDLFYIQWHHLAKKDLWNKVYILFCSALATSYIVQVGSSHDTFDLYLAGVWFESQAPFIPTKVVHCFSPSL
jgi:hypothetical protein